MLETPVLIVGGGCVGLVLALELQHHGVQALLVERNPDTTRHPKMDITNGRSMELLRRLGLADRLRAHSVPPDHPISVVFATALAENQMARFDYPGTHESRVNIRMWNDGRQALEPCLRISQVVLEQAMKQILEHEGKHIRLRFGWALEHFTQKDTSVQATIRHSQTNQTQEIRCQYLIGCDGANSIVRQGLGIGLHDIALLDLIGQAGGMAKNLYVLGRNLLRGERPADGRIYMIHFTSKDKALFEAFGVCWHLIFPRGDTLIAQNDKDIWTMHISLRAGQIISRQSPRDMLYKALGRKIDCEILQANEWRPRLSLAESYGHKRVWLAGDSVHQYIPTGGYGLNTGVGDAVGLGWKLAAILKGWGGAGLLPAYEAERRPIGERNRAASARHMAVRIKLTHGASPELGAATPQGARARARYGALIQEASNLENEAWGIEYGYRYYHSPIICHDSGQPPPYEWGWYEPTSWPGGRPPSLILDDDTALFDKLDTRGFSLLCFRDADVTRLLRAAQARNIPVRQLDITDAKARALYERDFVLIRPDQIVAWRGDVIPDDCGTMWNKLCARH